LAQEFGVGEKTIRRDAEFAEAVDKIVKTCSVAGARNLLLSRGVGVTRSGLVELAERPASEQTEFVEYLRKEGKRLRKPPEKRGATLTIPRDAEQIAAALREQLTPQEIAVVLRDLIEPVEPDEGQPDESPRKGRRRSQTASA
jgi:hypothetical protein